MILCLNNNQWQNYNSDRHTFWDTTAETGIPVTQLCRDHGMSNATFYKWRAKYDGMDTAMMSRLKELKAENKRLKKCMQKSD